MARIEENLTVAFAEALQAARPNANVDDLGYASFEDSLVAGLDADAIRKVFETADSRGAGTRQPRVYSAHSDIMILVNSLAPWLKDMDALAVAGMRDFRDIRFEMRLPAVENEAPAWLPALMISRSGVVGVESECTGYLSGHPVNFGDSLEAFWDSRDENGWRREMQALQSNSKGYARLDAARLIKQYMGMRLLLESAAAENGRLAPATLLYLYWEPLNAARFGECDEHHEEIEQFAEAVAGSEIGFASKSYFDLWADWARGGAPSWLPLHLTRLHQRYSFRV